MSNLRVNTITNLNDDGPVEFSKGLVIGIGKTLNGDINVTGVVTATSFSGNAAGITSFVPNEVTKSRSIAYTFIT